MRSVIVVHYDEIALKRGARGFFLRHLKDALGLAVPPGRSVRIERLFGRLLLLPTDGGTLDDLASAAADVPGVAYVLPGVELEGAINLGTLEAAVTAVLPVGEERRFGVRVKRSDKHHPFRSEELGRLLGAHVLSLRPAWKVDLSEPEVWVRVELVNQRAFVAAERLDGPGGLPPGGSGRGVALLSGGIDSPVAAWMMMTRGLRLTLVHCHSAPYTGAESQEKVRELARELARFQTRIELVLVPFADPIQKAVIAAAPESLRVLLYRRFMFRIAERLAATQEAGCVITGEALGQVASQTLSNLASVGDVLTLPALRPLIGMSKQKIIDIARRIGTYPISIRPHDDCCTFFMPDHPATRSTPAELARAESALAVDDLVERTLAAATTEIVTRES